MSNRERLFFIGKPVMVMRIIIFNFVAGMFPRSLLDLSTHTVIDIRYHPATQIRFPGCWKRVF